MDRKGIIAVATAFLVLLIWQFEFAPKFAPPPPKPGATPTGSPSPAVASVAASPENTPALTGGAPSAPAPAATPAAAEPKTPEKITDTQGAGAIYHFTNLGGGIANAELTGYPAESGSNVDLNHFGTQPIGALSEQPGQGGDVPYTVTTQGSNVLCVHDQPGGLSITKKFTLPDSAKVGDGYLVALAVTYTNNGTQPVKSGGYYVYIGSAAPIHQRDLPLYTSFDWLVEGGKSTHIDVNWFGAGKVPLVGVETHPERPDYNEEAQNIGWAAINSQFFTTVAAPRDGANGTSVWAHRFPLKFDGRDIFGIEGALRLPAFTVAPGKSVTQTLNLYAGPKIYSVLKGLGDGQERILNFGLYSPISIVLLNVMNWLHSVTGSYAIAIIILTLAIRGALWPIQNKATASMRQMQELQPRMTELKEKFKEDPARMNQEVMKLYKEYKVNPLAGCIPMVIQIPIFFAFYRVLGTAIELRNSRFLWVHDLSQPDTVFHISGVPVNILPICMAVTMVAQMMLQPKTGDKSQQKMFMFMPLIFVMFCYNYASALSLYFTVGNVFSISQLYVTRKRTAPAPFKAPVKRRSR